MSRTVIKPNEHVLIAGRTGSGKTYLARKYLAGYKNVAVLDTKGTLRWPEVPEEDLAVVTRISELSGIEKPKIIYRPDWEEMEETFYNAFFEWVYRRQNTIVWVDEVMAVAPGPLRIPEYYKAILTRGRELNVAAWSLTQRPSGIPLVCMSEATHFFVFDLNMEEDRDRLARITGCPQLLQKPGRYTFWYHLATSDKAVKAKLVERSGGVKLPVQREVYA